MTLSEKILKKDAIVGIVGLGYVGLPLMLAFTSNGFKVIGFDVDESKKNKLKDGRSYIKHIPDRDLKKVITNESFALSFNDKDYASCDAIIICVPTPLTKNREPDVSYITSSIQSITQNLSSSPQLLILESTTYPGTTDELLRKKIEESGKIVGKDIFLAFSPEREDPGNQKFSTKTTPKVVGGCTEDCTSLACLLYSQVLDRVVPVANSRTAEMVKLLENIFRSVNIALVNELKIVCQAMGINIWDVIEAAATKPFGFMPFYPGPGLGGHCIPVDPYYLSWKAREYGLSTRFIELAGEVNTSMHYHVLARIGDALNSHGKSIQGSRILVCGVAYKKDVDDVRESPALPIIDMLVSRGGKVEYFDPFVSEIPSLGKSKEYDEIFQNNLYDVGVVVTDHSIVDYQRLVECLPLVVDCRHVTKGMTPDRVFLA